MKDFYNKDCMEGMKEYPDDYFDLAIVDPPYGGAGVDTTIHGAEDGRFGNKGSRFEKYREIGVRCSRTGGGWANKLDPDRKINRWDNAPPQEYFEELFRISKNQIIWGGEITSSYRPHDAFLFGENSPYRRTSQWRWQNTHGQVSMKMQRCLNTPHKAKSVSTQPKSQ